MKRRGASFAQSCRNSTSVNCTSTTAATDEALTAHLTFLRYSGRPVPGPQTDAGRVPA